MRRRQQQGHDQWQGHLQGRARVQRQLNLYPASGGPYTVPIKADGTFLSSDLPLGQMGVGIASGAAPGGMSMPAGTDMSQLPKTVAIPLKYKDPKTSGLT